MKNEKERNTALRLVCPLNRRKRRANSLNVVDELFITRL